MTSMAQVMQLIWRIVVAVTYGWRQVSSAKMSMGFCSSRVVVVGATSQLYYKSPVTSQLFGEGIDHQLTPIVRRWHVFVVADDAWLDVDVGRTRPFPELIGMDHLTDVGASVIPDEDAIPLDTIEHNRPDLELGVLTSHTVSNWYRRSFRFFNAAGTVQMWGA
jgi:hypothetical protein